MMENLALVQDISTKGGTLVGVLSANTRYILTFDVEGIVGTRLHIFDDNTGEFIARLNTSMYHKTGTFTHKILAIKDSNLMFEVVELNNGYIKNIKLERID